jgi:hypothetical protein
LYTNFDVLCGNELICVHGKIKYIEHITQYNIYKIVDTDTHNGIKYVMVVDDGGYLDSFPLTHFNTISEFRNNTINEILNG